MGKHFEKSLKKGDILLSEKPFAFVLKGSLNAERCDYCFKRSQPQKCSGCSFAHYCDRSCQKNGWTFHKYECCNIKKVAPRIVPDAARLLARILIRLHTGGAHKKSYYSETKFRVFGDLMSHYNEIKKDEKRIEHFVSLKAVLHDFLGDQIMMPNEAELLAIYGRMVINTFNILDPELKSIGSGIYLAASILDHSCSPNAVPTYDGTTIIIRTLQDVKTVDWLKVYISYTELLELPSVRQKELEAYYFLCQCKRCLDIEELGYMSSIICQNEDCNTCIKDGLSETTLQCSACNKIVSEETKHAVKDVVKFTQDQLEIMGDTAYLDVCRVCLKKQEKLLHPLNIYKVKVLDFAFVSSIGLENWESAFDYGKQLVEPYLKYYGEFHPSRGILFMMLGKLALLLNLIEEAKTFFKEAASILCITHGKNNVLVKEELISYMRQCLE